MKPSLPPARSCALPGTQVHVSQSDVCTDRGGGSGAGRGRAGAGGHWFWHCTRCTCHPAVMLPSHYTWDMAQHCLVCIGVILLHTLFGSRPAYRVSSETVYTCSLIVNCASHASPIIKWSIYFFLWIKIDAKNGITLKNWYKDFDLKMTTFFWNEHFKTKTLIFV